MRRRASAVVRGDAEPSWDAPGGLGIVERRSFATWHLAATAAVAIILGMLIGYSGKRPPKSDGGSAGSGVSLGGPSRSSATIAAPASDSGTIGPGASTAPVSTTVAAEPAPAASASSAAAACTSPKTIVIANTTGTGPSDLPNFTTTTGWCVGWIFDCAAAPGGSAAFSITVVPASGTTTPTAVVSETGRRSNGNTPQTQPGSQHLRILTDPGCKWGVKVTSS